MSSVANTKPENKFIHRVHKCIPRVYSDKTNNPYKGGIPDVFYTGEYGDLWVEYKYIPKVPKTATVIPKLSALQLLWLRRRAAEGRNVAVIVGCPQGGVVIPIEAWESGVSAKFFAQNIMPVSKVACWIHNHVGDSIWHLPEQS